MSPQVLQTLIGRIPCMYKPAYLYHYTRHPVKGFVFPGILPSKLLESKVSTPNMKPKIVEGILLTELTDEEMKIFDWFEAEEYDRLLEKIYIPVEDETSTIENDANLNIMSGVKKNEVQANVYVWCAGEERLDLDHEWDYETFRQLYLHSYLKDTVRPCKAEIDQLGMGIGSRQDEGV